MSLIIPTSVIEEIRFAANYDSYVVALMRLDPARFRGLGPDHTEAFVRHATGYCDTIGLNYTNDVTYVIFLMTYLGSHMIEDFRYAQITSILNETPEGFDDRIDRARLAFMAFGDRFIGKGMSLYAADLAHFEKTVLPRIPTLHHDGLIDALVSGHGGRSFSLQPAQRAAFHAHATAAVAALGLRDPTAHGLCLALGYWLGCGFYKDPLYPWVRDKAKAGDAQAIADYAKHRLTAQLRMMGGQNG